jgi:hypothetical protein
MCVTNDSFKIFSPFVTQDILIIMSLVDTNSWLMILLYVFIT